MGLLLPEALVPIVWIEEGGTVSDDLILEIKHKLLYPVQGANCTLAITLFIGLILILFSAIVNIRDPAKVCLSF